MYIDLLPVVGKYRGVTRCFRFPSRLSWAQHRKLEPSYNKYLDWCATQNDKYDVGIAMMLQDFCNALNSIGGQFEIVAFSDLPEEFQFGNNFLGFDVFGDLRCSAIEEGNIIDEHFSRKLNTHGLFSNYEDAAQFCDYWKGMIDSNTSPYEVEENPHPFCVWLYQGTSGE